MSLENLENRRRVGNYWKHLRSCSRKRSNIGPTFKSPFFSFLFPLLHTLPNTKTRKCLFTLSLEYIISKDGQKPSGMRVSPRTGRIVLCENCFDSSLFSWNKSWVVMAKRDTRNGWNSNIAYIFNLHIWTTHTDDLSVSIRLSRNQTVGLFFFHCPADIFTAKVLRYIFLMVWKESRIFLHPTERSNISHLCIKVTSIFNSI